MNKLFLHIGTHKTGSTALQQGLLFARKTLLKNGFDVIIPYGFAHELGRIVQQTTPNSVPERAKTARTKFKQMLEAAITKRSVIVSSEHFSGVAQESYRDAELRAKTLVEIFRDFPTEVVVYYRRQDTFIESMYNHRIHQGFTESFDEFLAALTPFSFDWFEHASHFISAFGKENVTIRSYESLKKGGGILSDFIEIIGIPSDQAASLIEIAKQAPRQNRGYSPPALELARRANSVLDSEQKQHLRHLLQNVLADTKEVFGKHAHFTSEERRELLYRFEPSNRKLCQEAGIAWDKSGFVPEDTNQYPTPTTTPIEDQIAVLTKLVVATSMEVDKALRTVKACTPRDYARRIHRWLRGAVLKLGTKKKDR